MDGNSKEKKSTAKKSRVNSEKIKKRSNKQVKGQKDIRSLVKSKNNELLSYAKDFGLICRQSGIDVDPEQLQLAIALSNSLQDNKTTNNDEINTKKSLTCYQRRSKIRTTLQEYGFQTKKSPIKKVKRYRKYYKLILLSDTEKQEKIADKYAQILMTNICIHKTNVGNPFKKDNIDSHLYNLGTNVSYDCIKHDGIFYVNDLVQKSLHKSNILKDWCTIPGRPVSPKLKREDLSFTNIDCSQEELNIILSGTIATTQDIVKRAYESNIICTSKTKVVKNTPYTETAINQETSIELELQAGLTEVLSKTKTNGCFLNSKSTDAENYNRALNMSRPTNRSCSPDLFDDDVTIIMDSSKDKTILQEDVCERTIVKVQDNFMDLTNCVINSTCSNSKQKSCLSQGSNKTKTNQNEFMDLTECVPVCIQSMPNNLQSVCNYEKENCNKIEEQHNLPIIDLSQTPNFTSNINPNTDSDEKSLDDTIIMIDKEYSNINNGNKDNDVNQYKSLELKNTWGKPSIVNTEQSSENNNENINEKLISKYYPPRSIPDTYSWKNEENSKSTKGNHLDTIDLTQPSSFKNSFSSLNINSMKSKVISDSISNSATVLVRSSNGNNMACDYERSQKSKSFEGMDLTQSSNSEDCLHIANDEPCCNNKSLGDKITINNVNYNFISLDNIDLRNNDNIMNYIDSNSAGLPTLCKNQKNYEFDNAETVQNAMAKINQPTIFDIDNDREFDNLVENAQDIYSHNRNSFDNCTIVNESENSKLNLSNKMRNSENDVHSICNFINDDSYMNVNEESTTTFEDIKKSDNSSGVVVTNFLQASTKQSQSTMNVDNNPKIYNTCDSIFKYRQSSIKAPKSYCENEESNSTVEKICIVDDDNDIQNGNIDLTQKSDYAEDVFCSIKTIEVPEELGKRDNISVDYDEVSSKVNQERECEITTSYDMNKFVESDNNRSKDEGVSGSSQCSEVFDLSDNEFNYSINQHVKDNDSFILKKATFDIGGISIIDDFLNRNSISKTKLRCSCSSNSDSNARDNNVENCLPVLTLKDNVLQNTAYKESKSSKEIEFSKISTPFKSKSDDNIIIAKTPEHDGYIIKTDQVTPMPLYENMTSPERNEELDKFGIKPLKRKRAIQILTHIYNQTHPLMEVISNEECLSPSKKRRKDNGESLPRRVIASQIDSVMEKPSTEFSDPSYPLEIVEPNLSQISSKSRKELSKSPYKSPEKKHTFREKTSIKENIFYEETTLIPDIRNIECSPEYWIFQKKEKAKVHSCRVPLHIAFHNYVSSRKALREKILKYEPINIDDIHKGLVAVGYRYNPKDLLKFMDKKCITVKTADNSRKNKNT